MGRIELHLRPEKREHPVLGFTTQFVSPIAVGCQYSARFLRSGFYCSESHLDRERTQPVSVHSEVFSPQLA